MYKYKILWPSSKSKIGKFNDFIRMVVCLRSEMSFAWRYQIKNHRHFCNNLEANFLENHCFNYFEGFEQTQQEICPCRYFYNCFLQIICHKKVVYLVKLAPYLKICITKIKNCISLKEYFYCAWISILSSYQTSIHFMLLFSRKLKLSIYTSFWQVFYTVLFAKYWAVSLSHCFYVNVAAQSGLKRFANRWSVKRKLDTLYKQHQLSPN